MDNHYFNEQGEYIGSAPVQGDQLPPLNAIRVAPLQREGFWPVLNTARDGWELVEDHRGLAGWIDGQSATISVLGPLPAGWSDTAPVPEDRRTPEEKRRAAYCAKADPVRLEFEGYFSEAEAWRAQGDEVKATELEAKASSLRQSWLDIKESIRSQYPDATEEPSE